METLLTPREIAPRLGELLRQARLTQNITQAQLSTKANVSLSSLKKFESSGKISLESFTKLAFTLGFSDQLIAAFLPKPNSFSSLDQLIAENEKGQRQRAYSPRKKRIKSNHE